MILVGPNCTRLAGGRRRSLIGSSDEMRASCSRDLSVRLPGAALYTDDRSSARQAVDSHAIATVDLGFVELAVGPFDQPLGAFAFLNCGNAE